jgi:glycosyltransferase involved in cell wall biosynthesis
MKKKILHLITSVDNGGAENYLYDLISKQLSAYEVYLIYFKGNDHHRNNLIRKGAKVFRISFYSKNIFLFIINFFKVLKIYNKIQPDIIHCHLWISELYGLFLKLIFQKSFFLVITKHLDSFIFEGSFGFRVFIRGVILEKIIFQHANHIIFISKAVKKFFLKKINISKKKYSIIYYGLDFKRFVKLKYKVRKSLKQKLKISNKTFVLGCIARHVEQKSLDIVIKSFSQFLREKPKIKAKLIMIGKGHLENELRQLSKNLNIDNKIIWIRHTNDVNLYFNIFDIFCLSSKYEGFGLVLLESLASGVPVLATRSGAIPEIIKNKKNGYLVKYGDINNFSKRINDTLELSKKMSFKRDLSNLKNLFSLNRMSVSTDKVYRKAKIIYGQNEG